jgi:RNA polymerase sigma factor (sigma-70 family)
LSVVRVQRVEHSDRDAFVVATLREHATSMLALARRHSLCADDAHDAYQRAVEIFLRRADSLERTTVGGWLRTVVKHEAMAVRAQRQASVASEDLDLDARAGDLPTEDERVVRFDRMSRAAEALGRLKPQEARALVLVGQGHSYREISQITGWTYTKVNRCVTEGRRALLDRYARIEAGEECARWAPVLEAVADGEATARDLLAVRPHLRRCSACRATVRAYREVPRRVAALIPLAGLPLAGVADGRVGRVAGFLARAHEAIAAGVHERVALSVQKAQNLVEAASTGKLAAMAASTVALAGGGYVAGERLIDQPRHPPVARTAVRARRHAHHRSPQAGVPATTPAVYRAPIETKPSGTAPAGAAPSHAKQRPATSTHDAAKRSQRAAATEFSPDGAADPGANVAPAASAASGAPGAKPRTTPAKAPPARSAGPVAGAEFGP